MALTVGTVGAIDIDDTFMAGMQGQYAAVVLTVKFEVYMAINHGTSACNRGFLSIVP